MTMADEKQGSPFCWNAWWEERQQTDSSDGAIYYDLTEADMEALRERSTEGEALIARQVDIIDRLRKENEELQAQIDSMEKYISGISE